MACEKVKYPTLAIFHQKRSAVGLATAPAAPAARDAHSREPAERLRRTLLASVTFGAGDLWCRLVQRTGLRKLQCPKSSATPPYFPPVPVQTTSETDTGVFAAFTPAAQAAGAGLLRHPDPGRCGRNQKGCAAQASPQNHEKVPLPHQSGSVWPPGRHFTAQARCYSPGWRRFSRGRSS